jgi:hypothetical protein
MELESRVRKGVGRGTFRTRSARGRSAGLHDALHGREVKAQSQAAEFYDRAVAQITYAVGERVLIWQPAAAVDAGRKLHVPWVGSCRLTAITGVFATGKSEVTGSVVRAHVNRLKKILEGLVNASGVAGGYYPDIQRLISVIVGLEKETEIMEDTGSRSSQLVAQAPGGPLICPISSSMPTCWRTVRAPHPLRNRRFTRNRRDLLKFP